MMLKKLYLMPGAFYQYFRLISYAIQKAINLLLLYKHILNSMSIPGGVQPTAYTAHDAELLVLCHVELNTKLGHNHTSYEIVSVSKQVVAGTNTFFHLLGQPGNHKQTVTIHEPLGGAPTVIEVSHGHHEHKHGHAAHHEHH